MEAGIPWRGTDELVLCGYASGADATALGDHDGGGHLGAPTLGSIEADLPSDNSKVYERWHHEAAHRVRCRAERSPSVLSTEHPIS